MSGRWMRSDEGSQPSAIAFLAIIGLVMSAAIGAVAVLFKAHLLNAQTPWRKVPAALWALKGYPIVYQPFAIGFGIGLVLTVMIIVSTLFTRQKLHGEARWARPGEIQKGKLLSETGIVLGKFKGKVMRFGGPEHVMLEAPTRAGKGVGVIIPNLLDWPDSLVVLDIKQENYANTAGYRKDILRQQVLLFNPLDPTGRTVRWNPLGYINRRDPVEVINELQKIAAMLYPDPLTGEKFWAEGARTAFLASPPISPRPSTMARTRSPSRSARFIGSSRPSMPNVVSPRSSLPGRRPASRCRPRAFRQFRLHRLVGKHVFWFAPVGHVENQCLAEPVCRCGDVGQRLRSERVPRQADIALPRRLAG